MMLSKQTYYLVIFLCFPLLLEAVFAEQQVFGEIFHNSRNLLLPHHHAQKCQREVPVVFFQTFKNEHIQGNGSTIFYHNIEVCCEGFKRSKYNWHECVPDCSEVSPDNCRNGFCRSPYNCECFSEFVRNDRGACVQTCPISCENGRCYLNGTCACNPGYEIDFETRKFCRPICQEGCGLNQRCTAPGVCSCDDGYKMTEDYGCQPVCTPDCGHGMCVGPNQCQCFPGYLKRPGRNVCEAECYIPCENGFCESRYKCQCREGFRFDDSIRSCLPDCGETCDNGICISPGVCKCFDGYKRKDGICEPYCLGGCGNYGSCIEPNICGCGLNSQQRCSNGSCQPNGKCSCSIGYTHFVDQCILPNKLTDLISSYKQRDLINQHLQDEFETIIGRHFQI